MEQEQMQKSLESIFNYGWSKGHRQGWKEGYIEAIEAEISLLEQLSESMGMENGPFPEKIKSLRKSIQDLKNE
jgi:hypothetical protein